MVRDMKILGTRRSLRRFSPSLRKLCPLAATLTIFMGHSPCTAGAETTSFMPPEAQRLIVHYHMQPIPVEGGWFSQLQRTPETIPGAVLPARYAGVTHPISTAILLLETRSGFSALHRLKTAEIWHFYKGDAIHLLLLYPDGSIKRVILNSENPAFVVPEGVWQGSTPEGPLGWAFAGTTMAPGFIPDDFEAGERTQLSRLYPAATKDIKALTREKAPTP
ncbi:cupin domain-containing protein [Acetobacter senegalensis]|nr:cupin domain-containing protein [Acetobacter senegalensis]